jgi:hypothetical protein
MNMKIAKDSISPNSIKKYFDFIFHSYERCVAPTHRKKRCAKHPQALYVKNVQTTRALHTNLIAVEERKRQKVCPLYPNVFMATEKKIKPNDHTRDMGIKTHEGQDNEGHLHGSNQEAFNERRAQEHQRREDKSKWNKEDARGTVSGTESV